MELTMTITMIMITEMMTSLMTLRDFVLKIVKSQKPIPRRKKRSETGKH